MARRGGGGAAAAAAAAADGDDSTTLASAIGNGEDLGTIIRAGFEIGKPESLLQQLKSFVRHKESEIEELCRVHYEEFIRAVDELRNVLVDADDLKKRLAEENAEMQDVGRSLLTKLEDLIRWQTTRSNVTHALESLLTCTDSVLACTALNSHLEKEELYPALKTVDSIERDHLPNLPSKTLNVSLERHIPIFRQYVEKKVGSEFNDWLVEIRGVAREIGHLSMRAASAARQREEELRAKQRQAEEQSRWGEDLSNQLNTCYVLLLDDPTQEQEEQEVADLLDLTPVYRAFYIHHCLGLGGQFRTYYLDNRRLQLQSDLHLPPGPFLECHQSLFAQIAGFFIVEERLLRTGSGLLDQIHVSELWETALNRLTSVLEEQLLRVQQADHVLLVAGNASLLAATLRGYGYPVAGLHDALHRCSGRYHELLLADRKRDAGDVLANDKFEQMIVRRDFEYSMHVVAFGLQPEVAPAFPFVAPFSASVPDLCRAVRSFIDDSVSYLSHCGRGDYYDTVRRYVDGLITNVVNEALLRMIRSPTLGMSQAMQLAANLIMMEKACDFFAAHAARSCGVPPRLAAPLASRGVLRASQAQSQERMLELVNSKIDDFMLLTGHIEWAPDDAPAHGNAYLNEVIIYLETLTPSAQTILPADAFDKWIRGLLTHISDCIVGTLVSDEVRKLNVNAVMGINTDLLLLESFANDRYFGTALEALAKEKGEESLRMCLAEARQLVNLLLSPQPDLYLNPVIRERNYPLLQAGKVIAVAEKFKDPADRLFRGNNKQPSRKKAFDMLVKRLKEFV